MSICCSREVTHTSTSCHHSQLLPALPSVCSMANATTESTVAPTHCGDICCSLCTARQLFTLHLLSPVRAF